MEPEATVDQDVVVVLDIVDLRDRTAMEKHLRREGLRPIDGEPFAYLGHTTTHTVNTLLYIHDAVKKAIRKGGFSSCGMMVGIGEGPLRSYRFDPVSDAFVLWDMLGYNDKKNGSKEA